MKLQSARPRLLHIEMIGSAARTIGPLRSAAGRSLRAEVSLPSGISGLHSQRPFATHPGAFAESGDGWTDVTEDEAIDLVVGELSVVADA